MHYQYDEEFVEAAVQVCTSGRRKAIAPLQIARFQRERERLYSILDSDERNTGFFNLHLEWFREWGLEQLLGAVLQEFPLLPGAIRALVFRKPRGKRDEGAELYVNETGDRTGVVSMRPERLENEDLAAAFLRHELSHLQDMIDPAFQYEPELRVPAASLAQQRLARERYAVLWDVSIDGRLNQRGKCPTGNRQERWTEFTNAFGFWAEAKQQQVFESIWTGLVPTHPALEQLACDSRHSNAEPGAQPGGLCPLCGFSTFAWADQARLRNAVLEAMVAEFPDWTPGQGVCGRCFEIYRLKSLPAPSPA